MLVVGLVAFVFVCWLDAVCWLLGGVCLWLLCFIWRCLLLLLCGCCMFVCSVRLNTCCLMIFIVVLGLFDCLLFCWFLFCLGIWLSYCLFLCCLLCGVCLLSVVCVFG